MDFQQKTKNSQVNKENQENLEKTKNPRFCRGPDIYVKILDSWILGFLEVFLVFLVLLGNSWISSKKPRITRVFFGFPAKHQDLLGVFYYFQQKTKNSQVKQGKPRKPRENQESKILSWARHLKQQKYQHQLKTKKKNHKKIILKKSNLNNIIYNGYW